MHYTVDTLDWEWAGHTREIITPATTIADKATVPSHRKRLRQKHI